LLTGLLGVMRFLQTEWHRHERDRNGWEIERQEMKGRIARLEGSTRKADSSNKSLKKYISMLEKALKERDAQVKQLKAGAEVNLGDSIRDAKEKESSDFKKHGKRRKSHADSAD
jgi:striatin 1/3/4